MNLKALEEALQELAQETGLIIYQETTKYTKVSMKSHNQCHQLVIAGYTHERVSSFPCLGSVTNNDNSISEEITPQKLEPTRQRYKSLE
jgi:hypothetical protein